MPSNPLFIHPLWSSGPGGENSTLSLDSPDTNNPGTCSVDLREFRHSDLSRYTNNRASLRRTKIRCRTLRTLFDG
jgi:hypothetical protein